MKKLLSWLLVLALLLSLTGCQITDSTPTSQPATDATILTDPTAATDATEATDATVETEAPTAPPTAPPTEAPTEAPTAPPTQPPTEAPTEVPTEAPTVAPTEKPTEPPVETHESFSIEFFHQRIFLCLQGLKELVVLQVCGIFFVCAPRFVFC